MKRWTAVGAALGAAALVTFAAPSSKAANLDEGLELDANILDDAGGGVDWADLFDVVGDNEPTAKDTLPASFGAAEFVRDFEPGKKGPDFTTFATGSKDTLNPTPGWECNKDNNVIDKNDLVNVYAAVYTAVDGDIILYFALERFSKEGEANVGFWFN